MRYNNTDSNNKKRTIRNRIGNGIRNFVKKINDTRKMLKDPLISKQIKNIACDTGVNIKYASSNALRRLYYGLPIISLLYKHPGNPPKQSSCGVSDEPPVETILDESTIVAATLAGVRDKVDKGTEGNLGIVADKAGDAGINLAKDVPPYGLITGINSIAETVQHAVITVQETSKEISKEQEELTAMLDKKPRVSIGPKGLHFMDGIDGIDGIHGIHGIGKHNMQTQVGAGGRIIKRANKTRKIFRNS